MNGRDGRKGESSPKKKSGKNRELRLSLIMRLTVVGEAITNPPDTAE